MTGNDFLNLFSNEIFGLIPDIFKFLIINIRVIGRIKMQPTNWS